MRCSSATGTPPILVGLLDAPTTAMLRGRNRRSSGSAGVGSFMGRAGSGGLGHCCASQHGRTPVVSCRFTTHCIDVCWPLSAHCCLSSDCFAHKGPYGPRTMGKRIRPCPPPGPPLARAPPLLPGCACPSSSAGTAVAITAPQTAISPLARSAVGTPTHCSARALCADQRCIGGAAGPTLKLLVFAAPRAARWRHAEDGGEANPGSKGGAGGRRLTAGDMDGFASLSSSARTTVGTAALRRERASFLFD